jgi:hypothetical protein
MRKRTKSRATSVVWVPFRVSGRAGVVFWEGLRRSPNNGSMLFVLLESLKPQGKGETFRWVQREFEAAWKGADAELRLKDL